MAASKPLSAGSVLKQRHSKVCEALDASDATLRAVVTRFYSLGLIDATTKSAILRRLGHEGADMLMDLLEMKVDSKPERLQLILETMVQDQSLRDVFEDVIDIKDKGDPPQHGNADNRIPVVIESHTSGPTHSQPHKEPVNDDPQVDELRQIIKRTIDSIYSKLCNATSGSMSDLIRLMYQHGLVGSELLSDHNFDNMMKSFYTTLDFDESVEDLKNDCKKFIRSLDEVGGPARKAGAKISTELNIAVKEKLNFEFKIL